MREDDRSTPDHGWEKYCVACIHMPIANLILNSFIKMEIFLGNFCWMDENSRCMDTK
jgi:hypothetical protein